MTYTGHQDQKFGHISYAQHGDDFMLLNIFTLLEIDKPSYIDIGAHHPTTISNTKLLYDRGSRGVNVEPNPALFELLKVGRPFDININVGIGKEAGTFPFYMYSETSGRNTFSAEEAQTAMPGAKIHKTINLPVMTLNDLVNHTCGGQFPALLTMDIEGLDYVVLQSVNFALSSPMVICVETRRAMTHQMKSLLEAKGYFLYCRMGENLFFIKNGLQSKVY